MHKLFGCCQGGAVAVKRVRVGTYEAVQNDVATEEPLVDHVLAAAACRTFSSCMCNCQHSCRSLKVHKKCDMLSAAAYESWFACNMVGERSCHPARTVSEATAMEVHNV